MGQHFTRPPHKDKRFIPVTPEVVKTHKCPLSICTQRVDERHLMCPHHWAMLTEPEKRRLHFWRRKIHGGEEVTDPAQKGDEVLQCEENLVDLVEGRLKERRQDNKRHLKHLQNSEWEPQDLF